MVCKVAGISYRQLNYWTERGFLLGNAAGSGNTQNYPDGEVLVAIYMGALVRAGIKPDAAAGLAQTMAIEQSDSCSLDAGHGVRLVISLEVDQSVHELIAETPKEHQPA